MYLQAVPESRKVAVLEKGLLQNVGKYLQYGRIRSTSTMEE